MIWFNGATSTSLGRGNPTRPSTLRISNGIAPPKTPDRRSFTVLEGVRKLIAEVQEAIDDFHTEPFEFLDAGDQVD